MNPIPLYVLNNDYDPRRDNFSITNVTKPLFGSVSIIDKRYLLYTPQPRYAGIVKFNYTIQNSKLPASAEVTVEVLNHPPDLVDFLFVIDKNSRNNAFNLFKEEGVNKLKIKDIDDGDVLRIISVTQPKHGVTSFDDETVIYTPPRSFSGLDEVQYYVSDDNSTSSAHIKFMVVNTAPVAHPDNFIIPMNTMSPLDVLKNDFDINGDDLKIVSIGYHGQCTLRISEDQKFLEYLPRYGLYGITESFEYTITDGTDFSSSYGFVTIKNTPPDAGEYVVRINKNTVDNPVELRYSDKDPASTLTVSIKLPPREGYYNFSKTEKIRRVLLNEEWFEYTWYEYSLLYTPKFGAIYDDYMEYIVSDGLESTVGKITLKVLNTPPVAVDDVIDGVTEPIRGPCKKNTHLLIDVLVNDYDPNGDPIRLVSSSRSKNGGTTILSVNEIRYNPPFGFTGIDSFTYTIEDVQQDPKLNLRSSAAVYVTVVNTPPIAFPDTVTVKKGLVTSINVLANDFDENGDVLRIIRLGQTRSGASIRVHQILDSQQKEMDAVEYTALDSVYEDVFEYEITDGTSTSKAMVKVFVVNSKPIAVDDAVTMHWNRTIEIPVTLNDKDENPGDKQLLEVNSITQPTHGQALATSKSVIYTPPKGFVGIDTFTYNVKDLYEVSDNFATVTINVTNTPPIAQPDEYSLLWGRTGIFDVMANDRDPDNDPIYLYEISQPPSSGNASIVNGMIRYTAGKSIGIITFKYRITDWYFFEEGIVTVNVMNNRPIATNDTLQVHWRRAKNSIVINVLANDKDPDFDPIYIKSISGVTAGSVQIIDANEGTVRYTLENPTFTTTEILTVFQYTITDGILDDSAFVNLKIFNNLPKAENKVFIIHWRTQFTGTKIMLLEHLKDEDGDDLTIEIVSPPNKEGKAVVSYESGKAYITYAQKEGYTGIEYFDYKVSDGLASSTARITFDIHNSPPTAENIYINLPFEQIDTGVTINPLLRASDSDVEDLPYLEIIGVQTPANGIVSWNPNSINYKPVSQWKGEDSFAYSISDGLAITTKTITVNTLSDGSDPKIKYYKVHWSTQTTGSVFDVMAGIIDSKGQKLELNGVIQQPPSFGQVSIIEESGKKYKIHYKQNTNFLGQDSLKLQYTDGSQTQVVSVFITVYNNRPTATNKEVRIHWTESITIDLLQDAHDADVEDSLSIINLSSPTHGVLTNPSNDKRNYLYTPNKPYIGTDSFSFHVTDGIESVLQFVNVIIVNAAPIATTKSFTIHWTEHVNGKLLPVTQGDSDPDAPKDTIKLVEVKNLVPSTAGTITINGDDVLFKSLTPSTFRNQKATFTYTITDGAEYSFGEVDVNVVNSVPIGNPDYYFFDYTGIQTSAILDVLKNDSDADIQDRPNLKIQSVSKSNAGVTPVIDVTGKFITYTPKNNFNGRDTFTYIITDGMDESTPITVTIDISSQRPTANNFEFIMKWDDPPIECNLVSGSNGIGVYYYSRTAPSAGTVNDVSGKPGYITYKPFSNPSIYNIIVNNTRMVTDEFKFTLRDQFNQEAVGTVRITVWNRIPIANPDYYTFSKTSQNPMRTLNVLENDIDDESLIIKAIRYSGNAVVSIFQNTKIRYKALHNWHGIETFEYKAYDGQLESDWTTVTLNITNAAPQCNNVHITIPKGTSHLWDLITMAGCTDPNGDILSLSLSNPNQDKGTISLSNNQVAYTHKPLRSGNHVFPFFVDDGDVKIERQCTVTIPNNPPIAKDLLYIYGKNVPTRIEFDVLANATDPDPTDQLRLVSLDFNGISNCLNTIAGSIFIENSKIVFLPKNGWTGNCSVYYTIGDSDVDNEKFDRKKLTIIVISKPPVAVDDFFFTKQGVTAKIKISDVIANDYDPEGGEIEFAGLLPSSCSKEGYCHRQPIVTNDIIQWESDSSFCSTDKIDYMIRKKGEPHSTAIATIHLSFTSCICYGPLDVIFLIDGSGSIFRNDWENLISFTNEMANQFIISQDKVHIGIVQFSNIAKLELALTGDRDIVSQTINDLRGNNRQLGSTTFTIWGLEMAESYLEPSNRPDHRKNVTKVIILLTDGVSNRPETCTDSSSIQTPTSCDKYYTPRGRNYIEECKSPLYPGTDCSDCSKHPYFLPCSDPVKVARRINARRRGVNKEVADWKIVALGIGTVLDYDNEFGWKQVQAMSYDPKKARKVGWDNLRSIVNDIVDTACNTNDINF